MGTSDIWLFPDLVVAELGLGTLLPYATPEQGDSKAYENHAALAVGLFPEEEGKWLNCKGEKVPAEVIEELGRIYNDWLYELWLEVLLVLTKHLRQMPKKLEVEIPLTTGETLKKTVSFGEIGVTSGSGYVGLTLPKDAIYVALSRLAAKSGKALSPDLVETAEADPETFLTENWAFVLYEDPEKAKSLPDWEELEWKLKQDFETANLLELKEMEKDFGFSLCL